MGRRDERDVAPLSTRKRVTRSLRLPAALAAGLALACASSPFGMGTGLERDASPLALEEEEPMERTANPQVGLLGTRWLVRSYEDGQGGAFPLEGITLSVEFADAEKLGGSAGCNRYFAGYSIDGESIRVGPAASTRMMCGEPEGIMEQEAGFLAALAAVARFEHQAERLTLRDETGSTQVELVSAVTGTFSYRIRKAIPPDTRLRVLLEEVRRPEAPARLIAEHSFLADGKQLAFEFTVIFDPARIDPDRTYQLRAEMHDRERRLIMTTRTPRPVITHDHPAFQVEVTLDATADGPG